MSPRRTVYVISDLHIGGAAENERWPGSASFRMMTRPDLLAGFIRKIAEKTERELVINGDFVDFLAEEHETEDRWLPFIEDQDLAARVFERIVRRNQEVFDALAFCLERGNRLTIICGNHDLELTLPAVRRSMARALKLDGAKDYQFFLDGEAYEIGDALIEHGNRYDPANVVDHDTLRRLRSLASRKLSQYSEGVFDPPAGSKVVAAVMNPIKDQYPFIDLLKPESEPLFALLLALDPGLKWKLGKLAKAVKSVPKHRMREDALPRFSGDISAEAGGDSRYLSDISAASDDDVLQEIVASAVGEELARELTSGETFGEDIASAGEKAEAWFGVARLLLNGNFAAAEDRMKMAQQTIGALSGDRSFDDSHETGKRYKKAAEELAENYRFVIFGHTHHAKSFSLSNGAHYLNSGTWANLMRFPDEVMNPDRRKAAEALAAFHRDLQENRLGKHVTIRPSFVRLEVEGDRVADASLEEATL